MALTKKLVNERGVVTNYHKVCEVQLKDECLKCAIKSYASKEYRDAELHADYTVFNFSISVAEEESMGIRALCYTKIKALDSWKDAIDC